MGNAWENAAAFASDVYEGFQSKEQTVAVAIDIDDAYNRVQFKLLMDLLMQSEISITLTRWIAGALLERTVVMQLGNWGSALYQLSPVPFNEYIKGQADLNQNGPQTILTLADDGLKY